MTSPPLADTLRRYIRDSEASWSCGSFGAVAEFARDPDEVVEIADDGFAVVTARGGMRLSPAEDIRAIAYELATRHPDCWQHGVALCLPAGRCRLTGRGSLTELGPDAEALRPQDRAAVLFDLGLGIGHAEICVRTADPVTIGLLRAGLGRSLLAPDGLPLLRDIAAMSPNRVFRCRFGRIEVYQPIPGPKDKTPPGPHTHVLPKLLALGRTHAATLPIPDGWVPCMTLFPPNPIGDGHGGVSLLDRDRYLAFQELWARYGIPQLVDLKASAMRTICAGAGPLPELPAPLDRAGRATVEVALRQSRQLGARPGRDTACRPRRAQTGVFLGTSD
jgi:hypothetical protein